MNISKSVNAHYAYGLFFCVCFVVNRRIIVKSYLLYLTKEFPGKVSGTRSLYLDAESDGASE